MRRVMAHSLFTVFCKQIPLKQITGYPYIDNITIDPGRGNAGEGAPGVRVYIAPAEWNPVKRAVVYVYGSCLFCPSFKLEDHRVSKGEKWLYGLINLIGKCCRGDVVRQGGLERLLQTGWFFSRQVVQVSGQSLT